MTERLRWRDAEAALARLSAADRRTLLLLARLPFLWAEPIRRLNGCNGPASDYRCLARLHGAGLIDALHTPFQRGHSPALHHLSDLGLAAVALDQQVDPEDLARRNGLRGADLLALLPGLTELIAFYELLAALAASRQSPPDLLAWERPWRRRFQPPTTKAPIVVRLGAYAAFAWADASAACLLIPDRATFPLRAYRPELSRLVALRTSDPAGIPPLLIATSGSRRAAAWRALLDEVCRARWDAPLVADVVEWDAIRHGTPLSIRPWCDRPLPAERLVARARVRPLGPRTPDDPIPGSVGGALHAVGGAHTARERLGRVARVLAPTDRALLDLAGRHPYLPLPSLSVVLRRTPEWTRGRVHRLIALGLAQLLGGDEASGATAGPTLVELTWAGLAFVAAQQGLPLGLVVRHNGLAGGGPDRPVGARRQLLRHLRHTLGADAVFVSLHGIAVPGAGTGGELVEWRNAAACSVGHVRPDGYGIWRQGDDWYGFFVEYDRGTMSGRDYREKFAAYYDYRDSRRYERDYERFPAVLVVTDGPGSEERIAKALRAVAVGREPKLVALITTTGWINAERQGLLGPIWRDAWATSRRHWVAVQS